MKKTMGNIGAKGYSLSELKKFNRVYIKKIIYKYAPITRIEIASKLGLTLPTITTSVAAMLSDGLLEENSLPEGSLSSPQGGRKPSLLQFRADAAYAIGVELSRYNTFICVTDVYGRMVEKQTYEPAPDDYEEMILKISELIINTALRFPKKKLIGVGIGLPGFIESDDGFIRSNPRKSWNGKNLSSDLSQKIGMWVMADNNVRMRAIGEELFVKKQHPDVFAYYFISRGIACPLMIKDSVLAGYTAGAGEIGHTVITGTHAAGCDNVKCLDDVASETAILMQCRAAIRKGEAPILKKIIGSREISALEMNMVLRAQKAGDKAICKIMDTAIEYLGISLANLINLISPGLVIVDSGMMEYSYNRKRLLNVTFSYLYGLNAKEVSVEFLPFDLYRGARGGAAGVVRSRLLGE